MASVKLHWWTKFWIRSVYKVNEVISMRYFTSIIAIGSTEKDQSLNFSQTLLVFIGYSCARHCEESIDLLYAYSKKIIQGIKDDQMD